MKIFGQEEEPLRLPKLDHLPLYVPEAELVRDANRDNHLPLIHPLTG